MWTNVNIENLYYLSIKCAMIFVTVKKFFIPNLQRECLSSNKNNTLTYRTSAPNDCELFAFTAYNVLQHFKTKKCVHSGNGRDLNLSQDCNDINSVFQKTPNGQLMHTYSGKCIPVVSGIVPREVILVDCDSSCTSLFRMVQGMRQSADVLFLLYSHF